MAKNEMTREEAIDLLDNLIGFIEDNHGNDYDTAFKMAIKALEAEPCEDAISRTALLKQIASDSEGEPGFYGDTWKFINTIKGMPSVTPEMRTGKWLGTAFDGYADGYPVYFEWQCSECGCVFEDEEPTYKFCPNCGAKMKVE